METQLTRRNVLQSAGGLGIGAVAGCTGSGPTNEEKNTLRIGLASNWLETFDTLDNALGNRIDMFETLVDVDHDGQIQPAVATEWEIPTDRTWRFTLREDLEFHDGSPVDAEAVAFSLERTFEESPRMTDLPVESVTETEEFELEIQTDEPFAPLLSQLTSWTAVLLSPNAIEDGEVTEPISLGPFKFDSWEPGSELSIVPFEAYHGTTPQLERVTYEVVEDHNTRVLKLENDELDLIKRLPDSQHSTVEEHADLEALVADVPSTRFLVFNTDDPLFADREARQALTYAVDKQAIVDSVLGGLTSPATGVLPPVMSDWRNEDVPDYSYDPERAEELLKQAGWERTDDGWTRDDESLSFTLWTYDVHSLPEIAEIIQAQYGEVDIECEIRVTESTAMQDAKRAGEFDVTMESWSVAPAGDPSRLFGWYHSEDTVLNMPYENEAADDLVEQASQSVEREARTEAYNELQAIAMEDLPLAPLTNYVRFVATQKRVAGYEPHPLGIDMDLRDVSLETI